MSFREAFQRRLVSGAANVSLLGIAGAGATLAAQGAFAQTTPTPGTTTTAPSNPTATTPSTSTATAPTSNEDATHEAGESASQEAAENNGTFRGGPGGNHVSNEDATHEAGETAAQEAAENARAGSGGSTAPASPTTAAPSNAAQ
jgi:hypothetical protein